jgi:hypothetical protein
MNAKYKGKIYIIPTDFVFNGFFVPKADDYWLITTDIYNGIIDEYMIEFKMKPYEYDGEELEYSISLIREPTGMAYSGTAKLASNPDHSARLRCFLYKSNNNKEYLILGEWREIEEEEGPEKQYTCMLKAKLIDT